MSGQQTGVLVVRAWAEDGVLRARVCCTADVARKAETNVTTSSADEVVRLLRAWLEEVAAGPSDDLHR